MTTQPTEAPDREVIIDGRRYMPVPDVPSIMETPDLPEYRNWIPAVGDTVWSNFDSGLPMGVCIGYLNHPGNPRHGQPVIEVQEAEPGGFLAKKKGHRSICHPMFMWPFEPGSEDHHAAIEAGRFR
jgi:hypothetical protein